MQAEGENRIKLLLLVQDMADSCVSSLWAEQRKNSLTALN